MSANFGGTVQSTSPDAGAAREIILKSALARAPEIADVAAQLVVRNIGRESIIRATFLSLVTGRPAFFLGPFGINKTGTVQDVVRRIEGAVFYDTLVPTVTSGDQLVVESTVIEETVDSFSGVKSIRTRDKLGRAAEAHIVFADEIWKGDPRVLNTLIDLSRGGTIRHEGREVRTPLMAFIGASNEPPDIESGLGAMWSRMTIRVNVEPLDRAGKKALSMSRIDRERAAVISNPAKLSIEDIEWMRAAVSFIMVDETMVETVLDLYEKLCDNDPTGFAWLWSDDRRLGRVWDVVRASALLDGRTKVGKLDLKVLEYLLWDTPEQIPVVKAQIAPLVRTPLSDAQELIDMLLSPTGTVAAAKVGDRTRLVAALTQFEEAERELDRLSAEASASEKGSILELRKQLNVEKQATLNAMLGGKPGAK